MARPKKNTLDYFPHIIKEGKTMYILEKKFGNDGYAFWFKLLEQIGSQDGLVYDCNNPTDWMFLLAKTLVGEDTANNILDTLSELKAIDSELWGNKIIWIQNFVDGVADVYQRRSAEIPSKPSLCQHKPQVDGVNVDNNPAKNKNNGINDDNNPQSKVNETKLKENTYVVIEEFFKKDFWPIYPHRNGKKIGKEECLLFIKTNILENELYLLGGATQNYKNSPDVKKGIGIKDPIRFLKPKIIKGEQIPAPWKEWIKSEKENSNKINDILDDFNLPGNNKLIDTDAYIKAQDALFSK